MVLKRLREDLVEVVAGTSEGKAEPWKLEQRRWRGKAGTNLGKGKGILKRCMLKLGISGWMGRINLDGELLCKGGQLGGRHDLLTIGTLSENDISNYRYIVV